MTLGNIPHEGPDVQRLVKCRVCGMYKPVDGFYPKQIRTSGCTGECKECTKRRVKYRSRTDPKVRDYDKARAKLPHRKANSIAVTAKWRKENPIGYAAQSTVANALRKGILKREPCLFCGELKVHAHHRDYSEPLDVVWLCPKCHHRLHAVFPETEGTMKSNRV